MSDLEKLKQCLKAHNCAFQHAYKMVFKHHKLSSQTGTTQGLNTGHLVQMRTHKTWHEAEKTIKVDCFTPHWFSLKPDDHLVRYGTAWITWMPYMLAYPKRFRSLTLRKPGKQHQVYHMPNQETKDWKTA